MKELPHYAGLSGEVRELATELSARLNAFVDFITTMPNRVEAEYWLLSEDEGEMGLKIARRHKAWELLYQTANQTEWKPLNEGGLAVKLWAVPALPKLLEEMEVQKRKLATLLQTRCKELAALAEKHKYPQGVASGK